jgi:hypothetical protein
MRRSFLASKCLGVLRAPVVSILLKIPGCNPLLGADIDVKESGSFRIRRGYDSGALVSF